MLDSDFPARIPLATFLLSKGHLPTLACYRRAVKEGDVRTLKWLRKHHEGSLAELEGDAIGSLMATALERRSLELLRWLPEQGASMPESIAPDLITAIVEEDQVEIFR